MNDWLDDELKELRQSKEDQRRNEDKQEVIRQHTARLFRDMQGLAKDASDRINAEPELRKKTGGLRCHDGYTDKIIVEKVMLPSIYLTVTYGPNVIDIHRKIATGPNEDGRDQRESLIVDIDENGHPFFTAKDGSTLSTLGEAVHYIFRLFLHPELIEGGGSKGVRTGHFRM